MDLGIVTPQLNGYGGSEIYLLECIRRWQHEAAITVYTCAVNQQLLREFGISRHVKIALLPARIGPKHGHGVLEESVILPRLWEARLGNHDLYFLYLFPTQMIRRRPSVWFAAEPLRMLYDLRHTTYAGQTEVQVHFYPKLNYATVDPTQLDVLLQLVEKIDTAPECDRWATNSNFMAGYLENVYGKQPDLVVYPGVRFPTTVTPPPGTKRALSVGRLWKHKRVDLALRAFSMVPEGQLIIVGEGPEKPLLLRLRRELGLGRRVRFAGNVSSDQLRQLFADTDCCVYTPMMEPFGMVPLEAAAAGRAVVGAVGAGYTEILSDKVARIVPASPERIAEAITELFEAPATARELGEAARAAVAPYTWDRTATALLELFRETRTRRPRGSKRRVRLGAHYYAWYKTGAQTEHWNENAEFAPVSDFPIGGPYDSTDPAVIRRHLHLAVEAGLEFFVINLQVNASGLNDTELRATQTMLELIENERIDLRVSIQLSISVEDPRLVKDAIRTVRTRFMKSRAYQRHAGRPLLWYYLSGPFMGYFFFHQRQLAELNHGVHPIAAGALIYNKFLPRLLRSFFSGWSIYSPLETGPSEIRDALCSRGYRDFHEDNGTIRVFTISPGYDDSQITSYERMHSTFRKIPRRGLKTYHEMQDCVRRLDPPPDLVVVTSFNEFHENTHIEPTKRFQNRYLESTRVFADSLRGHATRTD
jgi:glycosyltransferase involved in cell wall biosynthesis